jgi:anaerobic magnesium-protoporphyrin IX monomethyl ester cyclase
MRILIVMPKYNNDKTAFYHMAVGTMYVSAYLKHQGFDVQCINLNHYDSGKLLEVLKSDKFDVVCAGGIHIHIHLVEEVLKQVKNYNPNIITIAGGSLVTSDPRLALEIVQSDYMVLGEGEATCADLIQTLEMKGDPEQVLGIAYKKDGEYFETPERPLVEDLDSIPFPDYEGFEYGYYIDNYATEVVDKINVLGIPKEGLVTGSRDCPAKCTFCFRTMGGTYRTRSVDNVIEEIQFLMDNYGINQISLSDEIFAMKRKRVNEFCEKIKPLGLFWAAQMRVNLADDETLRLMKESGCVYISYGFESASTEVLKSMQKGIRVEQLERAIELTKKYQMTIQANWIFGDPAETVVTAVETIEFNRRYRDININMALLAAYPGTPLYFNVLEKGLVKDRLNFYKTASGDDKDGYFNLTNMSYEDYSAMKLKIRLEGERLHLRGKLKACDQKEEGNFEIVAGCPTCNKDNSLSVELDKSLNVASNSVRVACTSCLNRFFIPYVEIVDFKKTFQRLFKKLTFNSALFMMFLLSLKFEPKFHYDKKVRYLLAPIYFVVSRLKLNTMMIKLEVFIRNLKSGQKQQQALKPGYYQPSAGI